VSATEPAALRAQLWRQWSQSTLFRGICLAGLALILAVTGLGLYHDTRDLNAAQVIWFVFAVLTAIMNLIALCFAGYILLAAAVWLRAWQVGRSATSRPEG